MFRDAIERTDRSRLGVTFDSFPRGSCGDTALLLGHFLKQHGFSDVTYLFGERGEVNVDWTSHAWLRVEGYVVDITADQFPEVTARVIVARDSNWHRGFEIENEHEGDFSIYDAATVAALGQIYAAIVSVL